ncbi:tRNA pseudouridine(55) synthase TruB [Amycolatopsis antarctica]|uniref:tRNA pseudouridine synthase B n=1 Tax=Amycolatopsis antarctica TaxID=1854586 RepID=A0A263D870_9PSEU|nr:tRNA pseudouridine(55) synthase TruB [Amycolatopsis antarctica]OZM74389.1 tRNA pseudouridine(55) synthase TruB [Amycolatopsis antarctica]
MSQQQSRRPRRPAPPPGLLVVDKPGGMTSHDVVARARRIMGTRKVGHAGTLDPMATGVLVLGIERATKLLGHLAMDTKAYLATIRLGSATGTDDAEGEVLSTADASAVTEEEIHAGVAELTGDIMQVPSSVSAVKVNGRRAYEIARSGESVELAARPVTVSRFDVLSVSREDGAVEFDAMVDCSSGTYVRALARDLGSRLGVGGHLGALRRTRVGPFGLARARTLDQLEQTPELSLGLDDAVRAAFPRVDVDASVARALTHGQAVPPAGVAGTYGVFGPDAHAIALLRDEGATARPVLVLTPAG